MLLFVPPYCRCHDDGRFPFTVIDYGLGLAVTSLFLWTAPHTNEILDFDTSKSGHRARADRLEDFIIIKIFIKCNFFVTRW